MHTRAKSCSPYLGKGKNVAEEEVQDKIASNYTRVEALVVDAIARYKAGLKDIWYDLTLGFGPTPVGLTFGWWLTVSTRGLLLEPRYAINISCLANPMPDKKDIDDFVLHSLEALKEGRAKQGVVNNGEGLPHGK
jgi:hypothetical protein